MRRGREKEKGKRGGIILKKKSRCLYAPVLAFTTNFFFKESKTK